MPVPDAGGGGCAAKPTISVEAPTTGATITVHTPMQSTWYYDFKAAVTFCGPMRAVQFDYQGPRGICAQQRMQFTTPANPFTEHTQVGGSAGALATCGTGQSQSWQFLVTATDAQNRTTTASIPFTLSVINK
jgi:hypothetical protein